jgi:hypothetical protein
MLPRAIEGLKPRTPGCGRARHLPQDPEPLETLAIYRSDLRHMTAAGFGDIPAMETCAETYYES